MIFEKVFYVLCLCVIGSKFHFEHFIVEAILSILTTLAQAQCSIFLVSVLLNGIGHKLRHETWCSHIVFGIRFINRRHFNKNVHSRQINLKLKILNSSQSLINRPRPWVQFWRVLNYWMNISKKEEEEKSIWNECDRELKWWPIAIMYQNITHL